MKIPIDLTSIKRDLSRWGLCVTAAAGLLSMSALAYADTPVTMAPPVQPYATQDTYGVSQSIAPSNIFNWTELPQNQQVFITRAVFDRGGYQLYDTVGETIVVPFTNQNLYVMKFARSNDGRMYFVNAGNAPVLYLPESGYLENATVPGARWYPFNSGFDPTQPVYMGIAPNWPDYVDMGWYPGMICSGGYYSYNAFGFGGPFLPTFGLLYIIGNNRFHDFDDFRRFHHRHPAPFRTGFRDPNIYRFWNHRFLRRLDANGRPYFAHRPFQGARGPRIVRRTFPTVRPPSIGQPASPGNRGRLYEHRTFPANRPPTVTRRTFPTTRPPTVQQRTFPTTRPFVNGGNMPDRQFYEHRTFPTARPRVFEQRTFPTARPPAFEERSFPTARPPVFEQRSFPSAQPPVFEQRTFPTMRPQFSQPSPVPSSRPPIFEQRTLQNTAPMGSGNPSLDRNRAMGGWAFGGGRMRR